MIASRLPVMARYADVLSALLQVSRRFYRQRVDLSSQWARRVGRVLWRRRTAPSSPRMPMAETQPLPHPFPDDDAVGLGEIPVL